MTTAAGRLNVARGEHRLFPGESGLVRFLGLGCAALATVADDTSPLRNRVWRRRMIAKDARHLGISEGGLGDSLVARRAAIYDSKFGNPDLVHAGLKVRQQLPSFGSGISKSHVLTLEASPSEQDILNW